MTQRAATVFETPSSLGTDQQTPAKPPLPSARQGSATSIDGPSEAVLEFRIHQWRLLAASAALSIVLVVITVSLQHGFVLETVAPGESLSWSLLRSDSISDQIDELNSYSGNAASALGAIWTFALQLIVYVLVLAMVPALMIDNSTMWARFVLLSITGGVTWLAIQGFVATNVQLKPLETIPVLSFADLNGFNRDLMVNFQNYTPLTKDVIRNPQSSTATLLRTAIAGTYPRESVVCNVVPEGDHSVSASFGFSSYDWLRYVIPNGSTETTAAAFDMKSEKVVTLPMNQKNATSIAIFALEMTDSFFGVDTTVNTTRYDSLWEEFGSQASENSDGFLSAFQNLITSTFSDEKNYFQHFSTNESTIEFTQTALSDQITFAAVTFEIPLKRNFFSRNLTATLNTSSDGASSQLIYMSTPTEVVDDEDAVYEMAVWEDCTPDGCMLSGGLPEVNSAGVPTYPDSQVLAVRICLDANGNEDPIETLEGCQYGHSPNSFLVFSVASRIEGDSMDIDSELESTTRFRRALNEDSDSGSVAAAIGIAEAQGSAAMSSSGTTEDSSQYWFPDQDIPNDSGSSALDDFSVGAEIEENEIPGGDPTTTTPSQTPSMLSIHWAPTTPSAISATPRPSIHISTIKPSTQIPKIKLQAAKVFSFTDALKSYDSSSSKDFSFSTDLSSSVSDRSSTDDSSSADESSSIDDSSSTDIGSGVDGAGIIEDEIPGGDPTTTTPSQTPSSVTIRISTPTPAPTPVTGKPVIIISPLKTNKPKLSQQSAKLLSSQGMNEHFKSSSFEDENLSEDDSLLQGEFSCGDGNFSEDDSLFEDDSLYDDESASIDTEDDDIPENEIPGGDPTTPTPSVISSSVSIRLTHRTPAPSRNTSPHVIVQVTKPQATQKPKIKIRATKTFSFLAKGISASSDASSSSSESTSATSKPYDLSGEITTEAASDFTRKAYLRNARKIYTVTVGRMSWKLEDLADRFGARCNITHNRDCQGLTFELSNSSQQLVVGQQYLPLANLREYSGSSYLWTPLAKIKRDSGFGGDFAFKTSFTESNWPEDLNGSACKSSREEYIVSSLDNHFYSQHSFQPAYTSSIMWLFQYGTANDVIDLDHSKQSLAFAANIIRNGVIMSTPSNSSLLTYGACALVLGVTLAVSLIARQRSGVRPTRSVRTRTVAEVLLKGNQYPPLFVKCYVHPPDRQIPAIDVDLSITVVSDNEVEPLHSYSLQGLELQRNASSQWLSDRPTESV